MRYSATKMATKGLACGSSYALKFTPSIVLLVFAFALAFVARSSVATNLNGESYDYVNSRQFRKNLAVSKYRNNTFWLPQFQWTEPKISTEPRKRPKWETNDDLDENKPANEKTEWQKKMEEITRQEREKWKKYRAEKSETSSPSGRENQNRFSRSFHDRNKVNETIVEAEVGTSKARESVTDSRTLDHGKRSPTRGEDQFKIFEEIFGNNNNNNNNNDKTVDKNVGVRNSTALKLSKKFEEDGKIAAKLASERNSFQSSTDIGAKRRDVAGVDSFGKMNKTKPKKLIGDKSEAKTKIEGPREARKSSGKISRQNLRNDSKKSGIDGKKSGRFFKEMEQFIGDKKLSTEDILRSRSGMIAGREPHDKFFDDIARNKNNIEEIEDADWDVDAEAEAETQEEENKKQTRGSKISQREKSRTRKNLILKSKNEYWIRDDNREAEDPSMNYKWLSEAFQRSPKFVHGQLFPVTMDSEKFVETDSRGSAASKLIKIIIGPYAAAAPDRMELSIDRLIPESNGDSRMMELRPIVIGLSTTLCDKH